MNSHAGCAMPAWQLATDCSQHVDYAAEMLLVAFKHGRILGGAALALCLRGVVVKEVGAIRGLGASSAMLAGAASFARRDDAVYLVLSPVDSDTARFWGRAGFYPLHSGWLAKNRCSREQSELAARLHHEADARLSMGSACSSFSFSCGSSLCWGLEGAGRSIGPTCSPGHAHSPTCEATSGTAAKKYRPCKNLLPMTEEFYRYTYVNPGTRSETILSVTIAG